MDHRKDVREMKQEWQMRKETKKNATGKEIRILMTMLDEGDKKMEIAEEKENAEIET